MIRKTVKLDTGYDIIIVEIAQALTEQGVETPLGRGRHGVVKGQLHGGPLADNRLLSQ